MAELDGNTALSFVDAENGSPIAGASVTLNGKESSTDNSGKAVLPLPPDGFYKIRFQKKGYIISDFDIDIFGKSNRFTNHFAVSKSLPVSYMRISLCWGETPLDLDAQLVKKYSYHISYKNMKISDDKTAMLDIDETSSFGPETITVKKVDGNACYSFFVHNYSKVKNNNSEGLEKSKSSVFIYGDKDKVLKKIPININGEGDYWHVFDIIEGQIVEINKVKTGIDLR